MTTGREYRLRKAFEQLSMSSTYDLVLLDCPPALTC